MNLPKVDDEYLYTSEYYPMISDLKVRVKQSNKNFILIEVIDEEFVNKQLHNAKKHQREFQDWENTLEIYPLVERKGDELIKSPEISIFSLENFNSRTSKC